jgi:hypothetical protein
MGRWGPSRQRRGGPQPRYGRCRGVRPGARRFEVKIHAIIDADAKSGTHPLAAPDEGASWTQIGVLLGITKRAAWERYSGED